MHNERQAFTIDFEAAIILILVIVIASVLVRYVPAYGIEAPAHPATISAPPVNALPSPLPMPTPVYYAPPATLIPQPAPAPSVREDNRVCVIVVNCN